MKTRFASFLSVASLFLAPLVFSRPVDGYVNADDYPTLQAAVEALGAAGGEVRLGAKTYFLQKPVLLKHRIRFQGVMDSKVRSSVTLITAAKDFEGEWLFETVPVPAKVNADLNKDIFFFDLNLTGGDKISGIKAVNVDGMRLERCRLASLKDGILVTQATDLPRPWSWDISPGATFVNNCIFRCSGSAIRLEYSTQNRIYANWFVSGTGVALYLKNSDKTWFFANEINSFTRSAIVLEDDGQPGGLITDIFLSHNWINAPSPKNKYLEVNVHDKPLRRIQVIDNIFDGNGSADTSELLPQTGNRFANNIANQPGFASQATGEVKISKREKEMVVAHGLYRTPDHVSVTFDSEPPKYWIAQKDAKTFTVRFSEPISKGSFTWSASTGG